MNKLRDQSDCCILKKTNAFTENEKVYYSQIFADSFGQLNFWMEFFTFSFLGLLSKVSSGFAAVSTLPHLSQVNERQVN